MASVETYGSNKVPSTPKPINGRYTKQKVIVCVWGVCLLAVSKFVGLAKGKENYWILLELNSKWQLSLFFLQLLSPQERKGPNLLGNMIIMNSVGVIA